MYDFSALFAIDKLTKVIREAEGMYESSLAFDNADMELERLYSLQNSFFAGRIAKLESLQAKLSQEIGTNQSLTAPQKNVLQEQLAHVIKEADQLKDDSTGLHGAYRKAVDAIQDAVSP